MEGIRIGASRPNAASTGGDRRGAAWVGYATAVWCVLFAAPHVWWVFGVSLGLPGGDVERLRGTPWFLAYDLLVVLLAAVGVGVALAAVRPWGGMVPRRPLLGLAWAAAAALSARGLAGLVVDGRADLLWWPTFLVGGVLFALTAWHARGRARR